MVENQDRYNFYWEIYDVLLQGNSALDSNTFFGQIFSQQQAEDFLKGYGFEGDNPVELSELFGIFQESLQFIKRYFLKEGNPEGLDLAIPGEIYQIVDIKDLFTMPSRGVVEPSQYEMSLWATIILKVMHTILHADKDLRYRYFSTIQTQIFDSFYRYIHRDEEGHLFLKSSEDQVPLQEFETKARKSRDSIIIKLLHKKENVAEELFDRIGLRLITKTKFDALRAIKFLYDHHVIMIHNITTSRSFNSLIDMQKFRELYESHMEKVDINQMPEEDYLQLMEQLCEDSELPERQRKHNRYSAVDYKAIHFTGRQLIKYTNPFFKNFTKVRELAKERAEEDELAQRLMNLDTSTLAKDVRFFYSFEVQVTDVQSHQTNTLGEASHAEYKKNQLRAAMLRVFKPLIEFKNLNP